ncbi:hypothetical protein CEXT_163611 [Caerostris extrusa]|uniref:Uncharacterized protein n=1 Tax=Caerostris extrusa TaxID=172846 RepID=A0AAV4PV10_CAEEX|nr:hypothetical protein CEXT_163611 [Caerostris extrusa]
MESDSLSRVRFKSPVTCGQRSGLEFRLASDVSVHYSLAVCLVKFEECPPSSRAQYSLPAFVVFLSLKVDCNNRRNTEYRVQLFVSLENFVYILKWEFVSYQNFVQHIIPSFRLARCQNILFGDDCAKTVGARSRRWPVPPGRYYE